MSAPAPGSAPTSVPSALPRRICIGYFDGQRPHALEHVADRLVDDHAPAASVSTDVADDLRDREHADHQRDQADAAEQLGAAEGEAREAPPGCRGRRRRSAGRGSSVTRPFSGRSVEMNTAQVRPISTSQKYSNELNFSANSASAGAATISTAVPNRPPTAEKTSPAPSASSAWPLLRHRVGLVGVGGRRRRARHAQQAAGDVAGEDRHRRGGDDRRDRRDRRHEERHRHEQRRRHRRRQPRHRADEQAEQRRAQHHDDVVRLEHHREGLRPGGAHARPARAVTTRCRCSTPQGSGTLQQLVEREVDEQRHHQRDRQRAREAHAQHPHQRRQVDDAGERRSRAGRPRACRTALHADQHREARATCGGERSHSGSVDPARRAGAGARARAGRARSGARRRRRGRRRRARETAPGRRAGPGSSGSPARATEQRRRAEQRASSAPQTARR